MLKTIATRYRIQRPQNFLSLSTFQSLWTVACQNPAFSSNRYRYNNQLGNCCYCHKKSGGVVGDEGKVDDASINKGKGVKHRPMYHPPKNPKDPPEDMPVISLSHETQVLIVKDDTSDKDSNPDGKSNTNSSTKSEMMLAEDLVPPTNCCMSGCPNCVWLEYVERLTEYYTDPKLGKDKIHEEVGKIGDTNIKTLLIMELKLRGLW